MRWFTVIVVFLCSAVMLWLGVPRVIASLLKAPAHSTVLLAHYGRPLSNEQLDRAAGHLERAARWEDSGRVRTDLGYLLLLEAAQTPAEDPPRIALARRSADYLREGLTRAPARPHAWVRLAYARMIQTGPSPEIAALLEQSLKAGPFVGEITVPRLELLLRNWDHLSPETRTLTGKQIRFAWRFDGRGVVDAAGLSGRSDIVRFALRPLPGAVKRFDVALERSQG